MLHCDALLTFAAVTVEGFDQSREGPGEFVRLVQVLVPTFEGLLREHRASVALHISVSHICQSGSAGDGNEDQGNQDLCPGGNARRAVRVLASLVREARSVARPG